MSREDPKIVKLETRRTNRGIQNAEHKRLCRDADIIINCHNTVIKDRFGPGLGHRTAKPEELEKATIIP